MKVWQGKVEAFDSLKEQHARLQEDHSAAAKEAHIKRKQVGYLSISVPICTHTTLDFRER